MKVEEKIALDAITPDAKSHIELDEAACQRCEDKRCLRVCPAELYTLETETNTIIVDHSGCLECGTCLLMCTQCGIKWHYPNPGSGIHYRHG